MRKEEKVSLQNGKLYIGAISVPFPTPCGQVAPLHENACVKVEGIVKLLMAAANGEFVDEGFVAVCRDLKLLQYGSDEPSDIGILVWLQDLTDAVMHSRYYRKAVEESMVTLDYKIKEAESISESKLEARRQEFYGRIEEKYAPLTKTPEPDGSVTGEAV